MKLIAAVDENWAIGYKGQLLASIRADQRNFRNETEGKVVVLGRKTMDTFPGGRPLKKRRNIVLSSKKNLIIPDAEVVGSLDELKAALEGVPSEDIYIIGGASVYEQLLDFCDTAIITKIRYAYQADTYFPNLDQSEEWRLVSESDEETCYNMEYTFCRYVREGGAESFL